MQMSRSLPNGNQCDITAQFSSECEWEERRLKATANDKTFFRRGNFNGPNFHFSSVWGTREKNFALKFPTAMEPSTFYKLIQGQFFRIIKAPSWIYYINRKQTRRFEELFFNLIQKKKISDEFHWQRERNYVHSMLHYYKYCWEIICGNDLIKNGLRFSFIRPRMFGTKMNLYKHNTISWKPFHFGLYMYDGCVTLEKS